MNALFIILRAAHYATAMLLLGEIVFALLVVWPFFGRSRLADISEDLDRRFWKVARFCLGATVATGVAWFALEATAMSGLPIGEAVARETLVLVLGQTVFGQIFAVRMGLVAVLGAVLIVWSRSGDDARRARLALVAMLLASAYLGSLAGAGHAVAGDESKDFARIAADAAHLLAAGAWLGALPALVFLLGRPRMRNDAAHAVRRFSTLGLVCVVVLIASGGANTWFQVGSIPALVGTDYGRLLLAKLVLFAMMLGFATVNRGVAIRPVSGGDPQALRLLRRNAMLEIALGIGVIAIVGALGILVPATHQPAIWPFDRTLSLEPIRQSAWMQVVVSVLGTIASIAALTLVAGALGRPPRIRNVAVAGFVIPLVVLAFLLGVPAYPTTYLASPVPYAVDAIATGSTLYAENCSVCHGRNGDGAGQGEPVPPNPRVNLNSRVPEHAEGNLFWWIAHGVPGTPMPGFAAQLSDLEIWSLVQFLDAQVAAQNALSLSAGLKPVRAVPAPDFNYEFGGRQQESLRQQRGSRVVLLVFYTLPSSYPRLRELATLEPGYTAAGATVLKIPMPPASAAALPDTRDDESMLAFVSPVVASTYMMFARQEASVDAGAPAHVEYLVDRFGYIRVRHIGLPKATPAELAQTLGQIELLVSEPPRTALQWGHRH